MQGYLRQAIAKRSAGIAKRSEGIALAILTRLSCFSKEWKNRRYMA